jgi:hypothetical protein
LFVVTEEVETVHTNDNQYNPLTKTVWNRKAEQIYELDWAAKKGNVVPVVENLEEPILGGMESVQPPLVKDIPAAIDASLRAISNRTLVEGMPEVKRRGRPPLKKEAIG